MRTMRNAMSGGVLVAVLVLSGSVCAQSATGAAGGFDIRVKQGPNGPNLVCTFDKSPCSQDQVLQLGKPLHGKGLDVYLDRPDGSLRCTTRSGMPCTNDHFREVQATARAISTN